MLGVILIFIGFNILAITCWFQIYSAQRFLTEWVKRFAPHQKEMSEKDVEEFEQVVVQKLYFYHRNAQYYNMYLLGVGIGNLCLIPYIFTVWFAPIIAVLLNYPVFRLFQIMLKDNQNLGSFLQKKVLAYQHFFNSEEQHD